MTPVDVAAELERRARRFESFTAVLLRTTPSMFPTRPIIPPGRIRESVREFLERRLDDLKQQQRDCHRDLDYQRNEGAIDEVLGLLVPLTGHKEKS